MKTAELYIRNMVSSRCIVAIRQMTKQLDMTERERISLGRVVVGYEDEQQLA